MKQGRSLIRTIDVGVIVGVIVLFLMLFIFTWMTRVMDGETRRGEAFLVQAEIENAVGAFQESQSLVDNRPDLWVSADHQQRAVLRQDENAPSITRNGTRIGILLANPLVQARVRQAAVTLENIKGNGHAADFIMIGPAGAGVIAMISRWPEGAFEGAIALELLDMTQLMARLERFGIRLGPALSVDTAASEKQGQTLITSRLGEAVAKLSWAGRDATLSVNQLLLPALMSILMVGLFALLLLRHHWAVAHKEFRKELKAVNELAHTDPLTGLPNRRALFEHLAQAMVGNTLPPSTVLMLDLDGFKWVNDSLGHRVGDDVIARAARTFRDVLASTGFIARLGGDEFVIVIPAILKGESLFELYDRFARQLALELQSDQRLGRIGLSIGAVTTDVFAGGGDDLVRLADIALYAAKARGRGMVVSYEASMAQDVMSHQVVERELRQALMRDEFVLYHQPIVDSLSGAVRGHESLVRWLHPVRGLVPPGEFIPIAEASDLIVEIGSYVLDRALLELGPLGDLYISVNVTARQIMKPGFATEVADLLAKHGVDATRLCLELTETSLVSDGERVAAVMNDIRGFGVQFAIDDFGAGYASLGYLLKFKFDVLKIDRDFITALDDKPESSMIVMAVVSLARSLGMRVVGEGVETTAQHRFLASAGCNTLQGFLFGRPLPLSACIDALKTEPKAGSDLQNQAA